MVGVLEINVSRWSAMDRTLKSLFAYQGFAANKRLDALIKETESRYSDEIADDDLADVNAAGSGYLTSSSNKDNGGLVECFCQKKTGT